MSFNSYDFILVFLPFSVIFYYTLLRFRQPGAAKVSLIFSSLVFYGYLNYRFLGLLLFSVLFNYGAGFYLQKRHSKAAVCLGVAVNVLLLGYFKYANFFIETLNEVFNQRFGALSILLPLGISFITFQQISYIVDTYRGNAEKSALVDYVLYVVFFPKLIAGPIMRQKDLIPQIRDDANAYIDYRNICIGLVIFFIGLFRKVIIADNLGALVAPGFDLAASLTFFEAWAAAAAYTFQLYFDFSGYSEMAVGLGLLFNVAIPVNFASPYKANSIIEFWSRWHITLSTFLRDYLYISLGGNRKGTLRKYLHQMITMLIGGLWHGAGWTFVIWGGMHGLFINVNHVMRDIRRKLVGESVLQEAAATSAGMLGVVKVLPGRALTFFAVLSAWVFFRAQDVQTALKVLRGMFGLSGIQYNNMTYLPDGRSTVYMLLALYLWVNIEPDTFQLAKKFKPNWIWLLALTALCLVSLVSLNKISEFLYFQF